MALTGMFVVTAGASIGSMSPSADNGGLIITFPQAWTAEQRLEFMADVARVLPRERWAHVGELMGTDSIDARRPMSAGRSSHG